MSRWKIPFVVLLALSAGACSSSSGGSPDATEYEEQVGRVLANPLTDAVQKILPKYRLGIRRVEDDANSLLWETEWQTREVTAEERAAGVTDARQRAVIQGRRVGQTLDGQPEYRVNFTAYNQVRTEATPNWHPAPVPETFVDHWRRVVNDLKLEVSTGVRR